MARSILGTDAGLLQQIHTDEHEDHQRLVITTTQDLEPTLKNIAMRREQQHDKDFRPVAEIPGVIVEQMMRDGSWNDPAAMKRWLNDPQNDCFRIVRGKV